MLSKELLKYLNSIQTSIKNENVKSKDKYVGTPIAYLLLKTNASQKFV